MGQRFVDQAARLVQDNDGHWYLIPEGKYTTFVAAIDNMMYGVCTPEWFDDRYSTYRIDGPHRLRILEWEQM